MFSLDEMNLPPRYHNITGQRFKKLTVLSFNSIDNHRRSLWNTVCDCGVFKVVAAGALKTGHTASCGCLAMESRLSGNNSRRHGFAGTSLYRACYSMKQRCENPNHKNYHRYGGRGIRFNFRSAGEAASWITQNLGKKPGRGFSIDRINNDGHYEPGNMRWATQKEQMANTCIKRLGNFSAGEFEAEMHRRYGGMLFRVPEPEYFDPVTH